MDDLDVIALIRQHGAAAVHDAAYNAMAGRCADALRLGLPTINVLELDRIGRRAYKALTAEQRSAADAQTIIDLARLR